MKIIILLLFAFTSVFAQQRGHFRVYADVKSDSIFTKILDETYLRRIFPVKFQMVVNAAGSNPFVVIGKYGSRDVEFDRKAYRYYWKFFSIELWDGIMKIRNRQPIRS